MLTSTIQIEILCNCFRAIRSREDFFINGQKGCDPGGERSRGNHSYAGGGGGCRAGVSFHAGLIFERSPTRSESASVSRSLKRLVARGLVEPSLETQHFEVSLTDVGRQLAAKSLGVVDPYPTEDDYVQALHPDLTLRQVKSRRQRELREFANQNRD